RHAPFRLAVSDRLQAPLWIDARQACLGIPAAQSGIPERLPACGRLSRRPSAPGPRPFATTSPGAGGCDFLVDPDLSADENPVFWLPQLHAATVVPLANSTATANTLKFQPDRWRGKRIERRA